MAYIDPVIKKYIQTFEANIKAIKSYYQGDPFIIPKSKMPAVFISKTETETRPLNNAEDEQGMRFRLTLVADVRDDLGNTAEVVAGIAQLYDILEGRNDDYTLKDSTILQVIRGNINVDATNKNLHTDLNTITRIDYGNLINLREKNWFLESSIEFVAHFVQLR